MNSIKVFRNCVECLYNWNLCEKLLLNTHRTEHYQFLSCDAFIIYLPCVLILLHHLQYAARSAPRYITIYLLIMFSGKQIESSKTKNFFCDSLLAI